MAIYHPPRPGRARRSRGSVPRWSLGVGIALSIGVITGACAPSADDATLPDELVAAEDSGPDAGGDETGQDAGSDGGTAADGSVVAEGFDPIEDVENEPVPPAEAEAIDLTDDSPATVIDEVADEVDAADEGQELLDAVGPIDRAEPPSGGSDDGRPRNGVGELLVLDDEASLACAQVEIAIGQLDIGLPGVAAEQVLSAADRADASAIGDIRSWAQPLRAVVDGEPIDEPAPLIGFLSVCTEGGYEL